MLEEKGLMIEAGKEGLMIKIVKEGLMIKIVKEGLMIKIEKRGVTNYQPLASSMPCMVSWLQIERRALSSNC